MALLDLQTTGNRETVKIDDIEYALTDFDDFSPLEQINITRQVKRITDILKSTEDADLTDREVVDLEALTTELFERVAGEIPDDIRKKLLPAARVKVVNAYFLAFAATIGEQPKIVEALRIGPEKSSPDSSDSTEEIPKDG